MLTDSIICRPGLIPNTAQVCAQNKGGAEGGIEEGV